MYGQPLQFAPGTQDFDSTSGSSYSNFGYILLGMVIEKASGQTYPNYVKATLLPPLGLGDQVFLAHTRNGQPVPYEVQSYDAVGLARPQWCPLSVGNRLDLWAAG